MSTEERRALAIILTLILAAAAARWLERPKPLLDDVSALDLQQLEDASRAAADDKPTPRRATTPTTKLDLNTATLKQIEALPGIGKTVAERVIAHRATAPLRTMSDLQTVPGIGPALAARLAPFVLLSADPPPSLSRASERVAPPGKPAGPVDLNRATAAELETLSGVGPALAARLVAWRDSAGRFASWEDVDRVSGVGPALLAKLKAAARLQ